MKGLATLCSLSRASCPRFRAFPSLALCNLQATPDDSEGGARFNIYSLTQGGRYALPNPRSKMVVPYALPQPLLSLFPLTSYLQSTFKNLQHICPKYSFVALTHLY